ncbi:MAG: hypothetical protein WDN23_21990 [Edaphobacter sp.]
MNIEFVLGCSIALFYARFGKRPVRGIVLMVSGTLALAATHSHQFFYVLNPFGTALVLCSLVFGAGTPYKTTGEAVRDSFARTVQSAA